MNFATFLVYLFYLMNGAVLVTSTDGELVKASGLPIISGQYDAIPDGNPGSD